MINKKIFVSIAFALIFHNTIAQESKADAYTFVTNSFVQDVVYKGEKSYNYCCLLELYEKKGSTLTKKIWQYRYRSASIKMNDCHFIYDYCIDDKEHMIYIVFSVANKSDFIVFRVPIDSNIEGYPKTMNALSVNQAVEYARQDSLLMVERRKLKDFKIEKFSNINNRLLLGTDIYGYLILNRYGIKDINIKVENGNIKVKLFDSRNNVDNMTY